MTEPTPETPPLDPTDPEPTEPTPPEEQPAAPCGAVHPNVEGVVCELAADHFEHRRPHTAHLNGETYEWE